MAEDAGNDAGPDDVSEEGKSSEVEWVVTVDSARVSEIDAVAAELETAGLGVQRVLAAVGMVCGNAPEDQRERLLQVPGVADAEIQRRFTISPPDSDVQ